MTTPRLDPRSIRLKNEWERLQTLNAESETVRVDPVGVTPGYPPDKYMAHLFCRGIARVNPDQSPVYLDHHRVYLECQATFPNDPPALRWETDIWHPNVRHAGDKAVCINKPEWLGGNGLVDLVRMLFEMVQYKNYHAVSGERPYPLDGEVARWVREYGEPNGLMDKRRGKFVDNKPFTRPTVAPGQAKRPSGIRILGTTAANPADVPPASPPPAPRIRINTTR